MDRFIGIKINNYQIRGFIGKGSFGAVYKGIDCTTNNEVAIKIEDANKENPQLEFEAKIYQIMIGEGIPLIKWYGTAQTTNFLITEYMGPNLENLRKSCNGKFSLKTVLMIAIQMIDRITRMHNMGYIHRDIKPDNFLLGNGNKSHIIHIIDFGLSKKYVYDDGQHIKKIKKEKIIGTTRYTSSNVDDGIEPSRRDDMISIGHLLVYFLKGKLPWQGISDKKEKKKNITLNKELIREIKKEFLDFIHDCQTLSFNAEPNYLKYKEMFLNLFEKEKYILDFRYDWHPLH